MNKKIVCLFISFLLFFSVYAIADTFENVKAAVTSVEQCLNLIEAEKYFESWQEASERFKNKVNQKQWEQSLEKIRKPLGKLISRKVKTITYKTSLPGAPDGEYFVIQFESVFQNKKAALETITPMLDKDGKWRVSGYYIK
jgi:hypothetical protein